jgi:hypothetical protein
MALTIYTLCNPITTSCTLYTNEALTTTASNGEYSDGINVYTVTGGAGVVSAVQACTSSTDLFIYAKYVSTSASLAYSVNGGNKVNLGNVGSGTCTFFATITGLSNGDSIEISGVNGESVGGDSTGCPSSAGGCSYFITISTGANYAYVTINGSIIC